jgi:hypothetical protein
MLLHQQARLNPETEQIKQDLLNDKRLKNLKPPVRFNQLL